MSVAVTSHVRIIANTLGIIPYKLKVHFFTFANLVIKITSTSQTAQSGSIFFSVKISNVLFLFTKCLDRKQPDAFELAPFSMFGLTVLFLYRSFDYQLFFIT